MTGTDRLYLDIVQPFPPRLANRLAPEDLEALSELAKKNGQFVLVYWRLQRTASDNPAVSAFLKSGETAYLTWVARAARQEALEKRIISLLAGEAIPSLVIKGSALARDVYGDINSRSASDIDMLVRYEDMATVDRTLSQSGLIRQGGRKLEYDLLRIHHCQYFSPPDKMYVEIHWHFGVPCYFSLPCEEIWAGVRKEAGGRYALSAEMNIILLLVHHHSHAFRELRVLTDILWALHRYRRDINWQLLWADIKKYGLSNAAAIICGQIEYLWGDYADELPLADLHKAGLGRPGLFGGYFRICPGSTGHVGALDKIAKRLTLDGGRRVLRSFTEALFPPLMSLRSGDKGENSYLVYFRYLKELVGVWLRGK
jgi:hypothetical protein